MSQPAQWGVPTTGPASPDTFASRTNASLGALLSRNKGPAAPSYKESGTDWIDDSATPWTLKTWDGTQWIIVATIDPATHLMLLPYSRLPTMLAGDGQLKFPATQAPSTDANTLDEYEEGSWTPSLTFGGASTGITYSGQTGSYVKVGQLVFLQGRIALSSKGSASGTVLIQGLPFVPVGWGAASINYYAGMSSFSSASLYLLTPSLAICIEGATTVSFAGDANFTNTSELRFALAYRATQ